MSPNDAVASKCAVIARAFTSLASLNSVLAGPRQSPPHEGLPLRLATASGQFGIFGTFRASLALAVTPHGEPSR